MKMWSSYASGTRPWACITVALLLIVKEIYQTLHNLVSERLISAFCILVNTVQEYDSEDDQ